MKTKTQPSFAASRRVAFTTAAVLLAIASPRTQDPQDPVTTQTKPAESARRSLLIQVDFSGGTLTDYLEVLRRARLDAASQKAKPVNIIVDGSPEKIVLPPFQLVDTTMEDAIQVLERLARGSEQSVQIVQQQSRDTPPGRGIYVISARTATKRSENPRSVHVFSIGPLLQVGPAGVVLGAVEAGLALDEDKQAAQVRFHEASGLLFVNGTSSQVAIVDAVVSNLMRSLHLMPKDAGAGVRAENLRPSNAGTVDGAPGDEKKK